MTSRPKALSTGGTTEVGRATARQLHEQGHEVVVTGANPATLAEARHLLPPDVITLQADARSLADASDVARFVTERFGKLDVVFLNAGIGRMLPIEAVDGEAFDEHFAANVKG